MKILLGTFFLVFGILLGSIVNADLVRSFGTIPHWVLLHATDFWIEGGFLLFGFVPLLFLLAWLNWWWERNNFIIILHSFILGFMYAIFIAISVMVTFELFGFNNFNLIFFTTNLLPLSLTVLFLVYGYWFIKIKNI